jgi:Bardet-Biedl syndrome 1 protein
MDRELNIFTLMDDLKTLLEDLGVAYISSRAVKFLSLKEEVRQHFLEQYQQLSLVKVNVITSMGIIRKDSWAEVASSYLIIGTEFGEILILDNKLVFLKLIYTTELIINTSF